MKKSFIFTIACALTVLVFPACKSFDRVVHNNTLYSQYVPRAEIAVNEAIQYVGSHEKMTMTSGSHEVHSSTHVKKSWWAFGEPVSYGNAQKYLKRGIVIQINELHPTSNWEYHADQFARMKNKLEEGQEAIQGKNYNYAIISPFKPFSKGQEKYLESMGFSAPTRCVAKASVRKISSTAIIIILYYESVQSNHAFFDDMEPMKDDQHFSDDYLQAFLQRCQEAMDVRKYTGEGLPPDM